MRALIKPVFLIWVLMTGPAYSFGQQIPDSLLKYMEVAAANNPEVMQRLAEYEASLKKIPQAGTLPDPQLELGVFLTPMEIVSGLQMADLRLMQMFPWFGVLRNARDEMSLMAKAKFELFRDSKLQVCYEVQKAWYELFRIRKEKDISEKNIEILRIIEQLTLTSFSAPEAEQSGSAGGQSGAEEQTSPAVPSGPGNGMRGMGANQSARGAMSTGQAGSSMQSGSMGSSAGSSGLTDLYRIRIETGELQNRIASLNDRERVVVAQFNGFLNRPPSTYVYTADVLIPDTLHPYLSVIPDSLLNNNPMLGMLSFEQEAYRSRKKMVTGMGFPMVGLGLSYSLVGRSSMSTSAMNGMDMIMPMVSVTVPVYRKKYRAMKEEADLLGKAGSYSLQAASNSLNSEYYSAIQLYNDARRRMELYYDQYELASRSFEIMLKAFRASTAPLADVLRARQQLLDYELKQVEAITDFGTASAWLNRLAPASKFN